MTDEKKQPKLQSSNEDHIARTWLQVAKMHGRDIHHAEGQFWEWSGHLGMYTPLSIEQTWVLIMQAMHGYPYQGADGEKKRLRCTSSVAKKVAGLAQGMLEFTARKERRPIVATERGTWVALLDGQAVDMDATPASFVTSRFPVRFDRSAPAPERWLQTLEELWDGDEQMAAKIAFLHEYVGLSLFGLATQFQMAVILYGEGGNGKSVVTDTVIGLFDRTMLSHVAPQDWSKEYYAAQLAGSRLNIVEELPSREILASSSFKSVISGGEITARHIRQAPFKLHPVCGHIFATNELPRSGDMSTGFWRRAKILEFNNRFDNREGRILSKDLVAMHLQEAAGIFRLLVEGAERVLANNRFTHVDDRQAIHDWKVSSCSVTSFLDDCTEVTDIRDDEAIILDDLYAAYRRYAERGGFRPVNVQSFSRRAQLNGIPNKRMRTGLGKRERFYSLRLV